MKYLPVAVYLISAVYAIPAVITAKAVLPEPDKRDLQAATSSVDQCLTNFQESLTSAINSLQAPPKNLNFLSFCSTYLRQTSTDYLWTSTTTSSVSAVAFSTTFPVTTSTATATGTTTVLCPRPSPSQVCGGIPTRVWGFVTYPNYENISPAECKQVCLASKACKAFLSSLEYDRPIAGLPGNYVTYSCGISDITLQQAMNQGTLYIPYDPKWKPNPGDAQGFYDRSCPEFLPAACARKPSNEMQTIDSTTLEAATPKQMSQDVEFHSLASANLEHEKKMVRKDAAVYESFDDLTKTLVYAFQLTLICRCEPVQPIPPATITITGVATHYLTTSTRTFVSTRTILEVEHPAVTTVVRRV